MQNIHKYKIKLKSIYIKLKYIYYMQIYYIVKILKF